ncbi:MAG: thiopurine S-methyltransferase [Planctomycetes bacterium]|nr:thiopurine S-methyltransferase [Planctomycetota bacterium]
MATPDDWLQRWDSGNINFHRRDVHPALLRHWRPRGGSVLVPLCGKSLDLRWLAERGHTVVGVELAERAIRDFFAEQGLTFDRRDGVLPAFAARELPITLFQGDWFAFRAPPFDALYDRAALVALPPELRAAYAAHGDTLLREGAFRLVVALEYDQTLVPGPPFSVPGHEVRRLWPGLQEIERRSALDDVPPKFRAAGALLVETVWRAPHPA